MKSLKYVEQLLRSELQEMREKTDGRKSKKNTSKLLRRFEEILLVVEPNLAQANSTTKAAHAKRLITKLEKATKPSYWERKMEQQHEKKKQHEKQHEEKKVLKVDT